MKRKSNWDCLVIGGGAAGAMAAIVAARQGQKVLLLEKNEKIGKKLYITGKGRCNLTNAVEPEIILKHIPCNAKFLYGALNTFTSHQLMAFFEELGCSLKVERGQRVFPVSDKSVDVLNALDKGLSQSGVTVWKHTEVKDIILEEERVDDALPSEKEERRKRAIGVYLANGETVLGKRIVLATGGLAYPATGSTGDGYHWAEKAGHRVESTVAGLAPIETEEQDFVVAAGFLLKNVGLTLKADGKSLYQEQGEVQFTRFGLSGALTLSASSYLPKEKKEELWISLDLKPALSQEQLDARLLREIENHRTGTVREVLKPFLPDSLFQPLIQRSGINVQKKASEMSKKDRQAFLSLLKNLQFRVKAVRPFREAIITRGGVCVKEINPKTMESKKVKNLFLAGEILDVDALTGGFNLQIAFSTGYLAGIQQVEEE